MVACPCLSQESRRAAEEATRKSVTESREGDQEEYLEAMTVSDSTRPSSAINWILGINEVEKRMFRDYSIDYSVSNLEVIIIDTVASIESVTSSNIYRVSHKTVFALANNIGPTLL